VFDWRKRLKTKPVPQVSAIRTHRQRSRSAGLQRRHERHRGSPRQRRETKSGRPSVVETIRICRARSGFMAHHQIERIAIERTDVDGRQRASASITRRGGKQRPRRFRGTAFSPCCCRYGKRWCRKRRYSRNENPRPCIRGRPPKVSSIERNFRTCRAPRGAWRRPLGREQAPSPEIGAATGRGFRAAKRIGKSAHESAGEIITRPTTRPAATERRDRSRRDRRPIAAQASRTVPRHDEAAAGLTEYIRAFATYGHHSDSRRHALLRQSEDAGQLPRRCDFFKHRMGPGPISESEKSRDARNRFGLGVALPGPA